MTAERDRISREENEHRRKIEEEEARAREEERRKFEARAYNEGGFGAPDVQGTSEADGESQNGEDASDSDTDTEEK